VLHQHCDDDVDEHELRHEHEDDEKHRSDHWTHAAVANAVVVCVAIISQRVLITLEINKKNFYSEFSSVIEFLAEMSKKNSHKINN